MLKVGTDQEKCLPRAEYLDPKAEELLQCLQGISALVVRNEGI
jgi:hypothetical protein